MSATPIDRDETEVTLTLKRWQVALLIEGLDSNLYEEAPQRFRNSGNVLDPRTDCGDAEIDEEAAQVCQLIDDSDETEAVLRAALTTKAIP